MAKVSIIHCENYDRDAVIAAVNCHFDNLGGISHFISPGEKVLVKPNLICPKSPSQPAQTHPALIYAAAKAAIEAGAKVTVADSPAWSTTANCLKALGIRDELAALGVEIRDMAGPRVIKLPLTGIKAAISETALDADKIINVPKLKAHQQMGATIAVKNMFGAVPGKRKAMWHYRMGENREAFAALLLGIFQVIKPAINIVDAVVAMEGKGPINGSPKKIGLIVASENALACELICSRVIKLSDEFLPVLTAARKFSLPGTQAGEIDIVGEDYNNYICDDFVHPRQIPLRFSLPRICRSAIKQMLILMGGGRS